MPSSSVKLGHHIFSNTAISIVNVLTKRRRKKKEKRVSCQSVNNLCILAQSLSQKELLRCHYSIILTLITVRTYVELVRDTCYVNLQIF